MIKLKTEVNKSAVMRELQDEANKYYAESWQPQMQVRAYMNGVHDLFKKLRIADVSGSLPFKKCGEGDNVCNCKNADECGYL